MTFPYEAETRLLRWAESSTQGRTITVELPPGNGEGHPFRGLPTGHQHGQRFRMRFEAIDDNEEPIRDPGKIPESRRPEEILIPPEDHRAASPPPPAGAHAKDLDRSMAAKERYASLDDRARAVADAGRLANDELFQRFASKKSGLPPSVELAASVIRAECGVGSRKEIAFSDGAYDAFRALVTEFEIETGRMAAPR